MWTIVAGIHSFITDRWKIDPDATVVFTGGDGQVGHILFVFIATSLLYEDKEKLLCRIHAVVVFVARAFRSLK